MHQVFQQVDVEVEVYYSAVAPLAPQDSSYPEVEVSAVLQEEGQGVDQGEDHLSI